MSRRWNGAGTSPAGCAEVSSWATENGTVVLGVTLPGKPVDALEIQLVEALSIACNLVTAIAAAKGDYQENPGYLPITREALEDAHDAYMRLFEETAERALGLKVEHGLKTFRAAKMTDNTPKRETQ